jgi:hypothetical protein
MTDMRRFVDWQLRGRKRTGSFGPRIYKSGHSGWASASSKRVCCRGLVRVSFGAFRPKMPVSDILLTLPTASKFP